MVKRIVSLLLIISLISTLVLGCSKTGDSSKDMSQDNANGQSNEKDVSKDKNKDETNDVPDYMNATGYPIAKEKITISALAYKHANSADWEHMVIFNKVAGLTNIYFDFEYVESTGARNEKKTLCLRVQIILM